MAEKDTSGILLSAAGELIRLPTRQQPVRWQIAQALHLNVHAQLFLPAEVSLKSFEVLTGA